jgi:hypothetical protein
MPTHLISSAERHKVYYKTHLKASLSLHLLLATAQAPAPRLQAFFAAAVAQAHPYQLQPTLYLLVELIRWPKHQTRQLTAPSAILLQRRCPYCLLISAALHAHQLLQLPHRGRGSSGSSAAAPTAPPGKCKQQQLQRVHGMHAVRAAEEKHL